MDTNNNQLVKLHQEMLEREQDVYRKQEQIKLMEKGIAEGQQAYIFLRDKYVSAIKSIVVSRGLNQTIFSITAESSAIRAFERQLVQCKDTKSVLSLLKNHYIEASEYERLAMVYYVMQHRFDFMAELQRVLLEDYRQDVATVRVLLNG